MSLFVDSVEGLYFLPVFSLRYLMTSSLCSFLGSFSALLDKVSLDTFIFFSFFSFLLGALVVPSSCPL